MEKKFLTMLTLLDGNKLKDLTEVEVIEKSCKFNNASHFVVDAATFDENAYLIGMSLSFNVPVIVSSNGTVVKFITPFMHVNVDGELKNWSSKGSDMNTFKELIAMYNNKGSEKKTKVSINPDNTVFTKLVKGYFDGIKYHCGDDTITIVEDSRLGGVKLEVYE